MTEPRTWRENEWRKPSVDRVSEVLVDSREKGQTYHYQCKDGKCRRRWRTTISIQKVCPFCDSTEGVTRLG